MNYNNALSLATLINRLAFFLNHMPMFLCVENKAFIAVMAKIMFYSTVFASV